MKLSILILAAGILFISPASIFSQATRPARNSPLAGGRELVKIDGHDLIVHALHEGDPDETIQTDENTIFILDDAPAKLEDLMPGTAIAITRTSPRQREKLRIVAVSPGYYGKVVSVDGANVLLSVTAGRGAPAKEVTVAIDEKTRIIVVGVSYDSFFTYPGHPAKVADLKPNMTVRVVPETGIAREILISPPHIVPTTWRMVGQAVYGSNPPQWVVVFRAYQGEVAICDRDAINDFVQKKVPAGATLEWATRGTAGEPLSSADEMDALKKVCQEKGIDLVIIPIGQRAVNKDGI